MNSFVKTCVAQIALLVALAVPVFAVGCERQGDPPIDPQSRAAPADGRRADAAFPDRRSATTAGPAARTAG